MDINHVSALHAKHAGIEARIKDETTRPVPDSYRLSTLKKQKLRIKQELALATG